MEEDLNGLKNRVHDLIAPLSGGLGKFDQKEHVLISRQMWMGKNFFDPFKFREIYKNGEATLVTAISAYRNAKGVFNYLNVPRVHRKMMTILNNLRNDFRLYQNRWNSLNPNDTTDLVGYWDVWIRDFFRHFQQNALASAE